MRRELSPRPPAPRRSGTCTKRSLCNPCPAGSGSASPHGASRDPRPGKDQKGPPLASRFAPPRTHPPPPPHHPPRQDRGGPPYGNPRGGAASTSERFAGRAGSLGAGVGPNPSAAYFTPLGGGPASAGGYAPAALAAGLGLDPAFGVAADPDRRPAGGGGGGGGRGGGGAAPGPPGAGPGAAAWGARPGESWDRAILRHGRRALRAYHEADAATRRAALAAAAVVVALLLWATLEDPDVLFLLAETVHLAGLVALCDRVRRSRSVAGLSLKMQTLTAVFLAARLWVSARVELRWSAWLGLVGSRGRRGGLWTALSDANNLHAALDAGCLGLTGWLLWTARRDPATRPSARAAGALDAAFDLRLVLLPAAALALVAHPPGRFWILDRVLWAFSLYVEAASALPQLALFHAARGHVDRAVGPYVFALCLSRYLCVCHWVLRFLDPLSKGTLVVNLTPGSGWSVLVLVAELVQSATLADFALMYVRAAARGAPLVRLQGGLV